MAEAMEDKSEMLNQFLKDQKQTPGEEPIVKKSREMAARHEKQKSLHRDLDILSRSQKEQKLDAFLKKRSPTRGHRRVTVSRVNQEYARILEQFLQSQLDRQDVQTKPRPGQYQRVVEVDIKEQTSPGESEDSPVNLPNIFIRGDSIPYADETDEDPEKDKVNSVPLDCLGTVGEGSLGTEIHHEKSRSAPHPVMDQYGGSLYARKKPLPGAPPPPPPPCTPHSDTENSREPSPVPYMAFSGKPEGSLSTGSSIPSSPKGTLVEPKDKQSSPCKKHRTPPPSSLDIDYRRNEKERSKTPLSLSESDWTAASRSRSSSSPSKGVYSLNRRENRMSGSMSSVDSDDSLGSLKGRKKKSFFKKTKERVGHLLRFNKDKSESPQEETYSSRQDVIKPKRKKKKTKKFTVTTKGKKLKADVLDELDMIDDDDHGIKRKVLEERHIHTNKHIHQHHTGERGEMLVRMEETGETVDVDRKKEKKHIERHWKVKESSDSHDTGFLSRLRRMTSKEKTKKSSMKGSKSSHFQDSSSHKHSDYSRTISVPAAEGESRDFHTERVHVGQDNTFDVTGTWKRATDRLNEVKVTSVVSGDDLKRHSSHLDIIDHEGSILQRLWLENPDCLPRNESFDFVKDTYIHEKKVLEGGHVTTEREEDTQQHLNMDGDKVEFDGLEDEEEKEVDESGMSEQDREELYEKIAERLAAIGDNFMTRKEKEQAERQTSPRRRQSNSSDPKSDDVIEKSTLNPLEREISDCLHGVANAIDEKLSDTARQATLQLAGQVTYNQFKNVVQEAVGNEAGLDRVGALLHITNRAVQLAGVGGALAMSIKDMSLRYFEDKFAGWIVEKGGWESMLSDTEDELD